MKKLVLILMSVLVLSFVFSSCALHEGLTSNLNNHGTQVVLSKKNYRIVAKVKGTASGTWVLCFGGAFRPLVAEARNKMLEEGRLVGSSMAVINETVEVNNKFFVVFGMKTVTVSAYIIEFTE